MNGLDCECKSDELFREASKQAPPFQNLENQIIVTQKMFGKIRVEMVLIVNYMVLTMLQMVG